MHKKRIKIIPCVFLFLKKGDKILLIRRFNTGYEDGKYSMVSGHIEVKETLEDALIREVKEEISIKIRPENLSLIFVMNRLVPEGGRVDFVFTTNEWRGVIKNNEPQKCDGIKWFYQKKLPKNIIPYIKIMIKKIIDKEKYYSLK